MKKSLRISRNTAIKKKFQFIVKTKIEFSKEINLSKDLKIKLLKIKWEFSLMVCYLIVFKNLFNIKKVITIN